MSTSEKLSSVSFFCPAYNDEKNLPILIPKVRDFLHSIADVFEIIIVDDGGPDRTGAIAEALAHTYPEIAVIHHPKNLGYGAALKTGFRNSKYEYVMYTDGDAQYDVTEFGPYLALLKNTDVLSGYVTKKALTFPRKAQSFVFNACITLLFFVRLHDINCSMKLYRRAVIDAMQIKSTSAFIDAEMLITATRKGFRIAQFPVTHFARAHGVASGSRPSVILATIRDMLKFRFGVL